MQRVRFYRHALVPLASVRDVTLIMSLTLIRTLLPPFTDGNVSQRRVPLLPTP